MFDYLSFIHVGWRIMMSGTRDDEYKAGAELKAEIVCLEI